MIMEEVKEKKFIIEAEGEVPFAQRTGDGYELFNNDRTMKFCARRQQIWDNETGEQKSCFAVFCFVKEDDGCKVIIIIKRNPLPLSLRI